MLHLTETNPTRCGFAVDHAALLRGLAHPGDLRYDPAPMGLPDARAAVTDYAAKVDPKEQLIAILMFQDPARRVYYRNLFRATVLQALVE